MHFLLQGISQVTKSANPMYIGHHIGYTIMLIATNIISAIMMLAFQSVPYTSFDKSSILEEGQESFHKDWSLTQSQDLLELIPLEPTQEEKEQVMANNIPSRILNLNKMLESFNAPFKKILKSPQPLSDTTLKNVMMSKGEFGFWTTYDKEKNLIQRFFVFQIEEPKQSTQRQVSVVSGNFFCSCLNKSTK